MRAERRKKTKSHKLEMNLRKEERNARAESLRLRREEEAAKQKKEENGKDTTIQTK